MNNRVIIQGEGRHWGARYYTLKPECYNPDWDNQIWREMIQWSVEQFGTCGDLWAHQGCYRWYVNNAKFWFRNQEDAVMFILRWS